jgi:hypothetical protein
MTVATASVIQHLIPRLAGALGEVRRTPGRGEGWVDDVLASLEREAGPRYERLRRRLGFAGRLGELAKLDREQQGRLALGLFFHELIESTAGRDARPSRAWMEFLLRNEEWLDPAFQVCQAVADGGWEELADPVVVVAKVTVVYDRETLELHARPLQVVDSLVAGARASPAAPLVGLLWSEDGQELCDHHFRRHPRGYKLEPATIRGYLALLQRPLVRARKVDENAPAAPQRLSGALQGDSRRREREREEREEGRRGRSEALDNFDRRREALRSRSSTDKAQDAASIQRKRPAALPDIDEPAPKDEVETDEPAPKDEMETDEPAPKDEPQDAPARASYPPEVTRRRPARLEVAREEEMESMIAMSAARPDRRNTLDLMERLQELRLQLGQIQRIASEADELLNGIAPQLDEVTSWVADLEAFVGRWRGSSGDRRAA